MIKKRRVRPVGRNHIADFNAAHRAGPLYFIRQIGPRYVRPFHSTSSRDWNLIKMPAAVDPYGFARHEIAVYQEKNGLGNFLGASPTSKRSSPPDSRQFAGAHSGRR